MKYGISSRIFIKVIGSVLFAALALLPAVGGAEQKGVEETIRKMNSALLESMKGADKIGFRGRYRLLSPVIQDVFALPFMGQVAMGSYWKGLSPEQRKQYMETYTDWTISSYAGNFNSYSGEKFEIHKGLEKRGDKVSIISNLVRPHDESVDFYYTLRHFQDGWRIVDIKIEGVSQLAVTRDQFVTVMKKKGFDGLISSLKEKIAGLHARE